MRIGASLRSAGRDHASWPLLLIILMAVLVPTAGVLWFMSQAINQQRDVTRQRLAEAYRSQLSLLRDRLDSVWEKRAADLARPGTQDSPSLVFQKLVSRGLADSVIVLNAEGAIAYPSTIALPASDPTDQMQDWIGARALENKRGTLPAAAAAYGRIAAAQQNDSIAARALQAQVRCLVRSGDRRSALITIERYFGQPRFNHAIDLQGRIMAADEQLLALNLVSREDYRYLAAARRLHTMLADYGQWELPSTQRLFLMEEMRALNLPGDLSQFPTFDAEVLGARFLESNRGGPGDSALRAANPPDLWRLGSSDGRVIGLYRNQTIVAAQRHFLDEQNLPPDVLVAVAPPGDKVAAYDDGTLAGPHLPGWQLTMTMKNRGQLDALARRQRESYIWVGILLIATMAVLALIAGQALRRQMRLASLKTDLVAAVSHELKTPLSSMRLLVDALLDDSELKPQKTRDYLELIAQENNRLSRLIDNFLTFSRMERNRKKFEFAEISPEEIVRAAVCAAGERFHGAQCRLTVEVSSGLSLLSADADAITTVVLNLLDNAYKFTPEEKHIWLRAYSTFGCICFEVEDNGIGLSPREQKKVFRRFYQVDRQLSRKAGGVGLGLSIVEFIVSAHHGRIHIKSQPGTGSTFTVLLPCAAESQPRRAEQQGAAI